MDICFKQFFCCWNTVCQKQACAMCRHCKTSPYALISLAPDIAPHPSNTKLVHLLTALHILYLSGLPSIMYAFSLTSVCLTSLPRSASNHSFVSVLIRGWPFSSFQSAKFVTCSCVHTSGRFEFIAHGAAPKRMCHVTYSHDQS